MRRGAYTCAVFRLVIICSGNRFRSPLAEAIIRARAAPVPLEVSSLGLHDLGPVPPLDEAVEIARDLGLDISNHRARPLKGQTLASADLVLGFERIHVAAAVVDASAPRDRTFTLPELVDLAESVAAPADPDPVRHARQLLAHAHAARDGGAPAPLLPEVPDPWGGTADVYAAVGARVTELSQRLITLLFGDRAVSGARETG